MGYYAFFLTIYGGCKFADVIPGDHGTLNTGFVRMQASWHSRLYSTQMLLSPLDALERCWADTDKFFDSLPNWWTEPISVRRPYGFYYGVLADYISIACNMSNRSRYDGGLDQPLCSQLSTVTLQGILQHLRSSRFCRVLLRCAFHRTHSSPLSSDAL